MAKYAALKHDSKKLRETYLRTAKTRGASHIHADIMVYRFSPNAKISEYAARACLPGKARIYGNRTRDRRCAMGFGKSPTQAVRISLRKLSSMLK